MTAVPSKQELVVSYVVEFLDKYVHNNKGVPVQECVDYMLKAKALDFKTEKECEEYLEHLKGVGELFEVRRGYIKKL